MWAKLTSVPEKLSLLYPKTLSGRLELFSGLRANVEVNEQRTFASERSIEEARQVSSILLRLEALCALDHPSPADRAGVTSPPHAPERLSLTSTRKSISGPSVLGPQGGGPQPKPQGPNPHLGPTIRENMTEDEIIEILGSMTTRIENCLSTLVSDMCAGSANSQYLKHLGGFTTVLAALERATRIDPNLLVHSLSLMNGALAQSQ